MPRQEVRRVKEQKLIPRARREEPLAPRLSQTARRLPEAVGWIAPKVPPEMVVPLNREKRTEAD
jgi:hypothetical protein